MTKLDTRLLILVLAIVDISDQELCDALEEFERTIYPLAIHFHLKYFNDGLVVKTLGLLILLLNMLLQCF